MVVFSQLGLLIAFCTVGYAAFACSIGVWRQRCSLIRSGEYSAVLGVAALTTVTAMLAWALLSKDFHFAYVAQYSSRDLPWYYSLSALWVGQSGSLLLWAWVLGISALVFRFGSFGRSDALKEVAFAVVLLLLFFLVAVLLFAADPTVASIGLPNDGAGLAPSLQHTVMLIHPPIVFLGYAIWTIPFAVAIGALILRKVDADWIRTTRSWAIVAWGLLGAGILLGGLWAYEEIGWGGYWSWDPVENGSLIPWLLGTAFLHAALAWRSRGIFKKTAIALAIATFACCNFAAFITRSGFFSSLHAFNQSPLGAMFLVLMAVIAIGGASLLLWRRAAYAGDRSLTSFWSRESWTAIFIVIMVLSAALVAIGTLVAPVSGILVGRRIAMEAAFYNKAMLPIGLLLVFATALAPLLRWGASPRISESRAIPLSLAAAVATVGVAWLVGLRHPVALTVAGLTGFGVAALVATLFLDVQRRGTAVAWRHLVAAISGNRRQYAGFLVHLGFLCLAVGITGSSRGTHRQDAAMRERETYAWSDWTIRLTRLTQQNSAGEITVSAHLEISRGGRPPFVLRPAQVFHECSNEWTGKTAIRSTWTEDFFVILQNGEAGGKVNLTFVENPLMRWIWFGGCIAGLGAIGGLLPAKRIARSRHCVPRPHLIAKSPIAQPPRSRVAHG